MFIHSLRRPLSRHCEIPRLFTAFQSTLNHAGSNWMLLYTHMEANTQLRVTRWCSGKDVGLATVASLIQVPVMTLFGYFCDRWPYFAGELSWDVTTTSVNSALHPSGVAKSSTSSSWGKGGKVTAAGWQVTLCDPLWHVISCSGVVISITNCYILTFTFNSKLFVATYHWQDFSPTFPWQLSK